MRLPLLRPTSSNDDLVDDDNVVLLSKRLVVLPIFDVRGAVYIFLRSGSIELNCFLTLSSPLARIYSPVRRIQRL